MAAAAFSSPLNRILLASALLAVTVFFLLSPPRSPKFPAAATTSPSRLLLQSPPSTPPPHCSSVLSLPPAHRCSFSLAHCPDDGDGGGGGGLLNYSALHFCLLGGYPLISLPVLALLLLFHFYSLVRAARDHFSPVVTALSARLRLSPSMAAVTLLALGNGAPDVFASVAALRRGQARTGLGAILSAGAFVSAFVVGSVAVIAAPFSVEPAPFIRDVFFYLLAASGLFYIYLSAEIFLWQALGFVGFYLFFVGLVFWMDLGGGVGGSCSKSRSGEEEEDVEMRLVDKDGGGLKQTATWTTSKSLPSSSVQEVVVGNFGDELLKPWWTLSGMLRKVSLLWEAPVTVVLKLTVPSISPSEWSRFYAAANICFCPLILLFSFNSFIAMDSKIVFLFPESRFPLWSVALFISLSLAIAHFILQEESPETEDELLAATLTAFVMSVFWISTMAGELLNCLATVGTIMDLPPAILGLTVLAWGNSVGDLVADVALAKAGQPAMAMAGCFVGPMFNMLVGLGSAMVIETTKVYPGAYELRFHVGVVVAFVFLLLSLMGSLFVVTWFRFRVPRFWGFCLVALYILFTAVSLAVARFMG